MSEAQVEHAVSQLYENEGLRSELTDDESALLLGWGETQIIALSARNLDDPTFEAEFGNLCRLIARINSFIGKRPGMQPAAQRAALGDIVVLAQALHYKVAPAEVAAFQRQALPSLEAIRVLTELINPSTPPV